MRTYSILLYNARWQEMVITECMESMFSQFWYNNFETANGWEFIDYWFDDVQAIRTKK